MKKTLNDIKFFTMIFEGHHIQRNFETLQSAQKLVNNGIKIECGYTSFFMSAKERERISKELESISLPIGLFPINDEHYETMPLLEDLSGLSDNTISDLISPVREACVLNGFLLNKNKYSNIDIN